MVSCDVPAMGSGGQSLSPQLCGSRSEGLGHGVPPCLPSVQNLDRYFIPSPHVAEQGVKDPHSENLWLTGQLIKLPSFQGQRSFSVPCPSQGSPPFFGGMHFLLLVFTPALPPSLTQDRVQLDHSAHGAQ